jgi:hypothetical protein
MPAGVPMDIRYNNIRLLPKAYESQERMLRASTSSRARHSEPVSTSSYIYLGRHLCAGRFTAAVLVASLNVGLTTTKRTEGGISRLLGIQTPLEAVFIFEPISTLLPFARGDSTTAELAFVAKATFAGAEVEARAPVVCARSQAVAAAFLVVVIHSGASDQQREEGDEECFGLATVWSVLEVLWLWKLPLTSRRSTHCCCLLSLMRRSYSERHQQQRSGFHQSVNIG